jgi:hypothetical protein
VIVFVPLSHSLVIVFVSLSYSSRVRIVFARDRMRYVGRPPGTQSQHLEPPFWSDAAGGPEPRPGPTRAGRSSPPVKARPELPAHVQVQIPRQRFGTFTQSLSGASTQRPAGRDGRAKRARTANRRYAGLNLNRAAKRRPASSANVLFIGDQRDLLRTSSAKPRFVRPFSLLCIISLSILFCCISLSPKISLVDIVLYSCPLPVVHSSFGFRSNHAYTSPFHISI